MHTYKGEGEYIGRGTKWGNPYLVKTYGRDKAITLFKDHLIKSDLIKDIGELENKTLICSCYPLKCHGDVLIQEIYKNAIWNGFVMNYGKIFINLSIGVKD